MAQLISSNVSISGSPIRQITSFQLSQSMFNHHMFRLVCPADSIDGMGGNILSASRDLIGGIIEVSVNSMGAQGSMQFKGIVMQVEADRFSGHTGNLILSGCSPTVILDNGPHCKSWEKKAIKNIAQDVLKHFPQNLLQPQISPLYPETLAYTVQYKQTAWQFLHYLCGTYGEWLYYDGEKLHIGPPKGARTTQLMFGSSLSHFSMALQVRPASSTMMAYDYLNHEVYNSQPQGVEGKAGLNDLGKHVFQASNTVYATQPKFWNNQFFSNKKQLDDVHNTRLAMQSSNNVRFSGTSDHPGVKLGGNISVQGQNLVSLSTENYGDYTVLSINHYFDGQGNYNNDFTAIPSSVKLPPQVNVQTPYMETQSAMVTDNHDPKGMGRVRVKFHWMNGAEKSPWMRVASPHGGGGKGMQFSPEVGEEVVVSFEGDSPTKGYIVGTVYHGKASNSFGNAGNDVKAIQTRSGNKVIMNDAEGSIKVEDKDGNSMLLDGAGNITLTAKKKLTIDATEEIYFKTKKFKMEAEEEVKVESKVYDGNFTKSATIFGKELMKIHSKTETNVESENKSNVKAQKEVKVRGEDVTNVESKLVNITGTADIVMVAAGIKLNC